MQREDGSIPVTLWDTCINSLTWCEVREWELAHDSSTQHTFCDFLIPIAISSIKVYPFYKLHIV